MATRSLQLPSRTEHTRSALFDRLSRAVDGIPAFNNHMHFGREGATLDWYFPNEVVNRNNTRSRGLAAALTKLFDLPGDIITEDMADDVPRRFEAFLAEHELTERYHILADLTNTSHIAFIARSYQDELSTLPSERLKIVIHIDQFLSPLDNSLKKATHPWNKIYMDLADTDIRSAEKTLGPKPADLDGYLDFIRKAIEAFRSNPHIIGGKWGVSYHRTLVFDRVSRSEAARIYESQQTEPAAYKRLQDFLAFHVLATCAELEFPVQIHTGLGAATNLILAESNPALLDGLLSRPELEGGRVCCLHGGYPFCHQLSVMRKRDNVWMDFSWMVLLLRPATLAGYLKEWLEFGGPDKLIFGVDGAGLAQIVGTWTARKALSLALTELVTEETMTEDEALDAARKILRDNALDFYSPMLEA